MLDIAPGPSAYTICYRLSDIAQTYLLASYQWNQHDAVDAYLVETATIFSNLAKAIARQTHVGSIKPVESKHD